MTEDQGKEHSYEYIKHTFDEEEKRAIASNMAETVGNRQGAKDEKKAIVSEFKSKIDKMTAEISLAAARLRTGYVMRNVKCEVDRDYKARVIRFYRTDNGDLGKERTMTTDELQKGLFDGESE